MFLYKFTETPYPTGALIDEALMEWPLHTDLRDESPDPEDTPELPLPTPFNHIYIMHRWFSYGDEPDELTRIMVFRCEDKDQVNKLQSILMEKSETEEYESLLSEGFSVGKFDGGDMHHVYIYEHPYYTDEDAYLNENLQLFRASVRELYEID